MASGKFVSKSRRVRFELALRILDLNNVPLVSGTSFIKWHLPASTAAEHRGRTPKCPIRDHRVTYQADTTLAVRLIVGKDGMLQPCPIEFEVVQEYSAGGRGERITLGVVRCNLAEYVDASREPGATAGVTAGAAARADDEGEGVVRRYLMQDSKINSTLKLGITMRHLEGTRDYYAPPLRTAPVFGGIAGIISSSEPVAAAHSGGPHLAADADGDAAAGPVPSLSTTNRELGEMQDMYRRTLAAYWASQPGELRADECIEDIFAGGDGFGEGREGGRPRTAGKDSGRPHTGGGDGGGSGGSGGGGGGGGSKPGSSGSGRRGHSPSENDGHGSGSPRVNRAGVGGRGILHLAHRSLEEQGRHYGREKHGGSAGRPRKGQGEIEECDARTDLRSWRIGERALS